MAAVTLEEFKEALGEIVEGLRGEIASLRTGRATPALIEELVVDYYGSPTPLKAIAAISNPEPRQLVIQPWDKQALQPIERAIQLSPLGMQPVADRDVIRLTVPALTEERRRELAKLLRRHMEDARIQVRRAREEIIKEIDRKEKLKEMSEDEKFRERDAAQKDVEEANQRIEELGAVKEKEILTV